MRYEDKLFQTGKINELNIEIEETEWKELLENASEKKYSSCDITINGEKLSKVGIRVKGGSSLDDVKGWVTQTVTASCLNLTSIQTGRTITDLPSSL